MPQRPKEQMRQAIIDAAAAEFAGVGFAAATLAQVAQRAGTSIGNVYKYFAGKDALFAAAVPDELAETLRLLLRRRMQAAIGVRDLRRLPPDHRYHRAAQDLLHFTLSHRFQILVLLSQSEGTPFAGFADDLAARLTRIALAYGRRTYPAARLSASRRRTLTRLYRGFLSALAAILREEQSAPALRRASEQYVQYHQAGLRAFFAAAERSDKAPPRRESI